MLPDPGARLMTLKFAFVFGERSFDRGSLLKVSIINTNDGVSRFFSSFYLLEPHRIFGNKGENAGEFLRKAQCDKCV